MPDITLEEFFAKKRKQYGLDNDQNQDRSSAPAKPFDIDAVNPDSDTHKYNWGYSEEYRNQFKGREAEFDPRYVAPEDPEASDERGFLGDIGSNLARGAADLTHLGGYALKTIDPDGGADFVERAGQSLVDAADASQEWDIMKPDKGEREGEDGIIKRAFTGAARSSVVSYGPTAVGALTGFALGGPAGAAIGGATAGALNLFGVLGLGTYGEKMQEFKDRGINDADAERTAAYEAIIESGGEVVSEVAGFLILGGGSAFTKPLAHTVNEIIKLPAKELAKRLAGSTFIEVATEVVQEGSQAKLESDIGVQEEGAWKHAMVEAIGPAVVMSTLFGAGTSAYTYTRRKQLERNLNNIEDQDAREAAVDEVEQGIMSAAPKDPVAKQNAQHWAKYAADRIAEKQPIELHDNFVSLGALDDEQMAELQGAAIEDSYYQQYEALNKKIANIEKMKRPTPAMLQNRERYLGEISELDRSLAETEALAQVGITEDAKYKNEKITGAEREDEYGKSVDVDRELRDVQRDNANRSFVDDYEGSGAVQQDKEIEDENITRFYKDGEQVILDNVDEFRKQRSIRDKKQREEERSRKKQQKETNKNWDEKGKEWRPEHVQKRKDSTALDMMVQQANDSESRQVGEGSEGNKFPIPATSPGWMRDVMGGKLTRSRIEDLATRYKAHINGEDANITDKMWSEINEYIIPSMDRIKTDHADDFMEKADYETEGFRFVEHNPVGFDFSKGDELLGFDGDAGRAIVLDASEDGVTVQRSDGTIVDMDGFDELNISAYKDNFGKMPEGYIDPTEEYTSAETGLNEDAAPLKTENETTDSFREDVANDLMDMKDVDAILDEDETTSSFKDDEAKQDQVVDSILPKETLKEALKNHPIVKDESIEDPVKEILRDEVLQYSSSIFEHNNESLTGKELAEKIKDNFNLSEPKNKIAYNLLKNSEIKITKRNGAIGISGISNDRNGYLHLTDEEYSQLIDDSQDQATDLGASQTETTEASTVEDVETEISETENDKETDIPVGTSVLYETKKGELTGTYLGPHPKSPNLVRVETEAGKKTFVPRKKLLGVAPDNTVDQGQPTIDTDAGVNGPANIVNGDDVNIPAPVKGEEQKVSIGREINKARKRLPKGYDIQKEIGDDGKPRLSLMENGKFAVNGLSYTEAGLQEAVRQAKVRSESQSQTKDGLGEAATSEKEIAKKYGLNQAIANRLKSGHKFNNIREARKVAEEITGEPVKAGSQKAKQIDEEFERAGVLVARGIVRDKSLSQEEKFDKLVALQDQMPNLSVRTSSSIKNQAYSTPLPIAFVSSQLAGVSKAKTVYEPSAGNGALLIEASGHDVRANEIETSRYEFLKKSGFINSTNSDATVLKMRQPQQAIIANPPFGTVKDENGNSKVWKFDKFQTTQIDQAIALNAMEGLNTEVGGKAVLILGSINDQNKTEAARKKAYRAKEKALFYKHLYDNYNVVDHFTVTGKMYSKQGAAWPVDILVIHGKGKSDLVLPGVVVPEYISTIDELKGKLNEENRMDARRSTGRASTKPVDMGETGRKGDEANTSGKTGGQRPDVTGSRGQGNSTRDGGAVDADLVRQESDGVGTQNTTTEKLDGVRADSGKPKVPRGAKSDAVRGERGSTPDQTSAKAEQNSQEISGTDQELNSDRVDRGDNNPVTTEKESSDYGKNNKVFTADRAEKARALLKKKLSGTQLNSGIDPEVLMAGMELAGYHVEAGARTFAEYSKKMVADIGDTVKPYLKSFYNAVRDYPGFDNTGMDSYADVEAFLEKQKNESQKNESQKKTEKKPSPKKKVKEKSQPENESEFQTPYTPGSNSSPIGTLVPINMKSAMSKALSDIKEEHGLVDEYVSKKLGYTIEEITGKDGQFGYFSGEQVDAIALAIYNIDAGAGFIIGDQTGVGKGRVVAAMLRYAMRQGLTPIFVTEKPNLYTDMYRDFTAIGMPDIADKILFTNSGKTFKLTEDGSITVKTDPPNKHNAMLQEIIHSGEGLPSKYKVVFTTYDQVKDKKSIRREFLAAMAYRNGMIVMDEAHNAGGSQSARVKPGEIPMSVFFRDIIHSATSVFYSSATYAKRPDVMDLYSKTDMRLAVDDISTLGAVIEAGGVPMQQAVATMLVEAKQYVRRERSFDGVEYSVKSTPINKTHVDTTANSFQEIKSFSDIYVAAAIAELGDTAAGSAGTILDGSSAKDSQIHSSGFSAVMHNLIKQFLLAQKTKGAVEHAIAAHKRGEKPIITLANTMGSFIERYANENGLNPGDGIGITFNDLIFSYLDKTRRYTEGTASGKKVVKYITDEELGPEGVAAFKRIKELVYKLPIQDLPVSPIDYMLNELEKAGIRAAEITGRNHIMEYRDGKTPRYRRRGTKETDADAKVGIIYEFNNDALDALVINRSASTGLSLHALPKFEGHDPAIRHMIIAQAEDNIDTHMQMLGRIHRAGQVKIPIYTQLMGDTPAEKRPAAILAKKMASLNANTTAGAKSDVTAKDTVDFINKYGDRVVAQLMLSFPEYHIKLGSPLQTDATGYVEKDAATKVTGRIPLLQSKDQESLYSMIEAEYNELIEQLNATGENDLEAKTFDTDARTIEKIKISDGNGNSPFQAPAYAELVDMKKLSKSYTSQEVESLIIKEAMSGKDKSAAEPTIDEAVNELRATYPEKLYKPAIADFHDYSTSLIDGMSSDKRATATQAMHSSNLEDWNEIASKMWPGRQIDISILDTSYIATVLNVKQSGNPKNPLALGTWKVTFAVPDSMRRVTFSFNKLKDMEWFPASGTGDFSAFDSASSEAREQRTILTGNILSAYAAFKEGRGRIINFTDNNGNIRQGVLTKADFNINQAANEKPIAHGTVSQAEKVVKAGHTIETPDGLVIGNTGGGEIRILAPSSKANGGRFFLDEKILKIIGVDFVKSGRFMRADVPISRLKPLLKRVIEEMRSIPRSEIDLASIRELLGINQEKMESDLPKTPAKNSQYKIAYHGTPHTWQPEPGFPHGRPRLDLIFNKETVGEGAWAYGAGWYSAEFEKTASGYQKNFGAKTIVMPSGIAMTPSRLKDFQDLKNIIEAEMKEIGIDDNNKAISSKIVGSIQDAEMDLIGAKAFLDEYGSNDAIKAMDTLIEKGMVVNTPSLYKLDIPDEVMPNLLDWDKPLSEQSEYVKKAVKDIMTDLEIEENEIPSGGSGFMGVGNDIQSEPTGADLYHMIEGDIFADPIMASEIFEKAGIPGNTHGGQSRGATGAKYVIWDQKVLDQIALLERNQEALQQLQALSNQTTTDKANPADAINLKSVHDYFNSKGQTVAINDAGNLYVRFKNGMGIEVELVNRFSDREYEIAINSGAMDKTGHIAGNLVGNRIKLASDFAKRSTIDHELVHLLENAGILSKADIYTLDAKIKSYAKDGKFKMDKDQRENRANFLAHVISDRAIGRKTPLGRIIQKVMDFVDSIVSLVKPTVRSMARGMESGSIYSKKSTKKIAGMEQYNATGGDFSRIEEAKKEISKWKNISKGDTISGLEVWGIAPNQGSISAELFDYEILGLKEVPMDIFEVEPGNTDLAGEIKRNKKIKPLIVVVDGHNDGIAYILEGSHRIEALQKLRVKSFPALVVVDNDTMAHSQNQTFDPNNPDIQYSTTRRDDPFNVPEKATVMQNLKYNLVDILNPLKMAQEKHGNITDTNDVVTHETLRITKAKEQIEDADRRLMEPMRKLLADNNHSIEDGDEFLYSRHANEANERLRRTTALNWLARLHNAMSSGSDKKSLEAQIGAITNEYEAAEAGFKKEIRKINKADAVDEDMREEQRQIVAANRRDNRNETQEKYYQLLRSTMDAITESDVVLNDFKTKKWQPYDEKPSGMTDAEARKLQKKWAGNETMKAFGDLFDQMNEEKLKISFEAGRMTKDEYDALTNTFEHYAPLKREGFEDEKPTIGRGIQNLGKDFMARGGSTLRATNLLSNAIADYEATVIKAKKAESAKAFKNFVETLPEGNNFLRVTTPTMKAEYDRSGNIKYVLDRKPKDNEIEIKVNGVTHLVEANKDNDHAMRVIQLFGKNTDKSGWLVEHLSKVNRFLAMVNTSLNPEFMISNPFRDLQTGMINMTDTEIDGAQKKVFKGIPKAMGALRSVLRKDGSHEWSKWVKRFQKAGAPVGWMDGIDTIEARAKRLKKDIDLMRPLKDIDKKRRPYIAVEKNARKVGKLIGDYNTILENAIRLSVFKTAVESGITDAKAAVISKNLTVNFNQKGAYGPIMNSLYLFSNAGIQGSAKIISVLMKSKKAQKIVGASIMASAMLAMANREIGGDDDDGMPYYDKIDDFVKERNIIFMRPGTKGKFHKVPLPWGYNVFWALGEELGNLFTRPDYKPVEGATRMLTTTLNAFNPLQSATILQTMSFTLTDPFVQVAENKTWSGSPLMPEGNPFSDTPEPYSQRYWDSARKPSVAIAKLANTLSLGNDVKPGAVDISPEVLDLVWDTFLGGAGKFAGNVLNLPFKMASDEEVQTREVPFLRRVSGEKSEYADSRLYRERKQHIKQLHEQAKVYPDMKRKLMKDPAYRMLNALNVSEKQISKLNRQKKRVPKSAQEPFEKRIEKIRMKFNEQYYRLTTK